MSEPKTAEVKFKYCDQCAEPVPARDIKSGRCEMCDPSRKPQGTTRRPGGTVIIYTPMRESRT